VPAGNAPPASPASIGQFRSDTVTPLALGANVTDGTVVVKATPTDPDANPVKVQVEMRPAATAFTGVMTHESSFGVSGSPASVQIAGLSGSYHWQVRAVDSNGAASAWVANGGSPDFTANAAGGAPPIDTRDAPNGDCSGAAGGNIDFTLLVAGFMAIGLLAAAVMPRDNERRDR
jgi:hypothetical protein